VIWRLPRGQRINQILKNPLYAGALAYGRTEAVMSIEDGRARKSQSRARKQHETWKVLILDNHPGYISWEEFLGNQTMLESNRSQREVAVTGAAKTGPALLGGLLRCGHCGRKMFVTYGGTGGRVPRYACQGERESHGSAACQGFGGVRVERAVVDLLLDAIRPAGVQAALDALDQLDRRDDEKRKALELALEKARYEVDRTRRQYDLVDPANRLVAGELELRWNTAMERVDELERKCLQWDDRTPELTAEDRTRLLELGRDLPALWNHPNSSASLKKRILRSVIEEIVIRDDQQRNHLLAVHWKGGVHSEIQVPRNTTGKKAGDTEETALELIGELSKVCNDQSIAAILNRLGYLTGGGKTWRFHSVQNARRYHRLKNHGHTGEWLTVDLAAKESGVSQTVIRRLISEGILPASQVVPTAPWIIERASLSIKSVQDAVDAVQQGRQLQKTDPRQAEFPLE